ncbi:UNVERIFIED_CONTAM: hypothetical protein RMT77_006509 [Armadillidium vulgare]
MPQHHRSVAFSNKKKKEQLKAKRERQRNANSEVDKKPPLTCGKSVLETRGFDEVKKILPPSRSHNVNSSNYGKKNYYTDNVEEIQGGGVASKHNRYNLKFRKVHNGREHLKKLQYEPVSPLPPEELEVDSEAFYPSGLDYPKRPSWNRGISKEELDGIENRSFRLFCEEIDNIYDPEQLSLYELNLETWRQLWRVTEMSDIILIVVDARFVAAHFPPYLYKHLVEKENKGVVLVMNKCDLVPSSLVIAWTDFCAKFYPKLIVVPFSSFEGKSAKKSTLKMAMHSSLNLIDACQKLVDNNVDLRSWRKKVEEEMKDEATEKCKILREHIAEVEDKHPLTYQRYKDNVLTIGTIGHPNVGKSSLINALMGKKVVSVSKTPGHTKHFQTIFITKNVKLCDCPGLVFPSLCPKQLQVVLGSYPIAQVKDPLSSIHYIACRVNMPKLLSLNPSDIGEDSRGFRWTPFHICEAWAKKRGYYTRTKGGRHDVFRAANELLRFTLVGFKGIIISLRPLGYSKNKELYDLDSRLHEINLIQNLENGTESNSMSRGRDMFLEEDSDSEDSFPSNGMTEIESSDDEEDEIEQNKFALLSLEET